MTDNGSTHTATTDATTDATSTGEPDVDVVVVGAGFAGMYLLHRLRGLGMSAVVIEAGDDVGGTWYWNRYPGARCDIQSMDYSYSFDPELDETWQWSEKYAAQPEILRYAQHVADRHDLRRDIRFSTRLESAEWDDAAALWRVHTSAADTIACRFYVMATGCLSMPKEVDIEGTERFTGDVYFTSRWPHAGVDLTSKRVAVIGTGSSAIQSIPIMAAQAAEMTIFQRTPNFSIPADNGPIPTEKRAAVMADRAAYRERAKWTTGGVPVDISETSALAVSDEERQAHYEQAWEAGGIIEFLGCYSDHITDPRANELISEFVRNKIRSVVHDPETAEALCPGSFPIGTKRLCVDTNYYQTYNLPHVRLVDLRKDPIVDIVEQGVRLGNETVEVDVIVYATGFDAMTGAIVGVDITGRNGQTLKQEWADGPATYLGLTAEGFPNLFLITGPGSPSVLSNMMVSIEQHVDWIVDCLAYLREHDAVTIEPTQAAVDGWVRHGLAYAELTLMPRANSWYMGANVPGKTRVFLPYVGGVGRYRAVCDEVAAGGYIGFEIRGASGVQRDERVIRPVAPDVDVMLELVAGLGLPPMNTMTPQDARAFSEAMSAERPPGPEVGEIVDGTLPGPGGELEFRRYSPPTDGPHPLIVYFHGGGWVFGSQVSDDPFCRDLCVRADAVVVSVDYRHAPEAPFPAAVDDAFAALRWVDGHREQFGADADAPLAVAGWSAGANLAAVVSQLARDSGPHLAAQLLLNPVTDGGLATESYSQNADGYILTADLMRWFWDHYAPDPADRNDPRAAPLHAENLAGLAPAVVITCEFDPLRDEGADYAAALDAAGVPVRHLAIAGHTHTSLTAVDALPSGAAIRADIAEALRSMLSVSATSPV